MACALGSARRPVVATVGVLVVVGWAIAFTMPATTAALGALEEPAAGPCSPAAVAAILATLEPGVVVTDRPMVAARAGHRAPPSLAVVSLKRRAAGLTTDVLVEEMERAAASGILRAVYLERFPWPGVERRLPPGHRVMTCAADVVFSLEFKDLAPRQVFE